MTRIMVANEFGSVLSGKIAARQHFARACGLLADIRVGQLIALDFSGVDYVSGSWINWALVPLMAYTASESNDYYIVIFNFPAISLDDLNLIADATHTPFLVSTSDDSEEIVVVGELDAMQAETLLAVQNRGDVTGANLADDKVKATAWNNRLRDLNLKRILKRKKKGREQVYSLVIPEAQYHG